MTSDYLVANLAAFLFTYLVHSTLLLGPVYWLVAKRRWPADPGLRSQLLKLVLLAPICTTLAFSALGGVHWGPQVSVANLGRPTASEASPNRVWMPSANSSLKYS